MKKSYYLFWFWIILSFCFFAIIGQAIEILINKTPQTAGAMRTSDVQNFDPDRLQAMNSDEQNGFIVLHRNLRVRVAFRSRINPKSLTQ